MSKTKYIFTLIVTLFFFTQCDISITAQKKNVLNRIEDFLELKRLKKLDKIDTNYIKIPNEKFFATFNYTAYRLAHSAYSPVIELPGETDPVFPSINSSVDIRTTQKLGLGLSYMGLGAKISFNLAKRPGSTISLNYYGNKFGVEAKWQSMSNLAANFKMNFPNIGLAEGKTDEDDGTYKFDRFSVNGYYVFNSRKFSYPAAISMKNIQRHSCGSFLLGASYSLTNTDMGNVSIYNFFFDAKQFELRTHQFSVGPGYAHNVMLFKNKVMLHATVIPMLLFTKGKLRLTQGWLKDNQDVGKYLMACIMYDPDTDGDFDDYCEEYVAKEEDVEYSYSEEYGQALMKKSNDYNDYINCSFGGQARLSLVFNLSKHLVLGSRAQYNFYTLGNENMFGSETSEWYVNTTLGYRF